MAEPRSAAEEARDPRTTPERLLELTEKHPQLQKLIVLNPSCPEVARQWILATNPWAEQAYDEQVGTGAEAGTAPDAEPGAAAAPEADEGGPTTAALDPVDLPGAPEDTDREGPTGTASDGPTGTGDPGDTSSAPVAAPVPSAQSAPPSAPAEPDEVSVWGEYPDEALWGTAPGSVSLPAAGSSDARAPGGTSGVRVADDAGVVPLGPAASGAAGGAAAAGGMAAGGAAASGMTAAGASAAGTVPPTTQPPTDGGGSGKDRSRRRAWFACGGCLLLALIVLIVGALAGRAWLTRDDDTYQRDSSTTAAKTSEEDSSAEETPTPEADPVSPAPDGAAELDTLQSPSGNISCTLEEDSASCSLAERDYSDADLEDCDNGPFSITVTGKEPELDCGESSLHEEAQTLEYDRSAKHGDMACTSRFDGMTCWNVMTGHGFMVNKATYETF